MPNEKSEEEPKANPKEKSLLETLADTIKAAAESIAHPTEGTPMEMPLNESGYELTHLHPASKLAVKPVANKKAAKKPAAKKKPKPAAGKPKKNVAKNAVKKAAKKAGKKVAKKKQAKSKR